MSELVDFGFRVYNKVERAVGKRLSRTSSYPYLSCDTYFSECDMTFNSFKTIFKKELGNFTLRIPREEISIYCQLAHVQELLLLLEKNQIDGLGQLLVGDSDEPLGEIFKTHALDFFKELYLVNHKGEGSRIFNLPIGLENKIYSSPLRLNTYKNAKGNKKEFGLLVCWNDDTNPQIRKVVRDELKNAKIALHIDKRIPFQILAKYTKRSFLVACPAGNGIDTHRIWESLYMGSLPVMLEKDASIFDSVWPIHKVSSWNDLVNITIDEAVDIYEMYADRIIAMSEISTNFISRFGRKKR